MEYPTASRGMETGYGSNNYDGAAMASLTTKVKEPVFQRVDKQIEIVQHMAAEAAGRSSVLAEKIAGPRGNPAGRLAQGDSPRPIQGIVDNWSDSLRELQATLDELMSNISRLEAEL